jgi:ribosomal protein L25 (general stress protein Ctc)
MVTDSVSMAEVQAQRRSEETRAFVRQVRGQPGQVSAGVLHHLQEADTVLIDHQPVDLPHLLHSDGGYAQFC